MPMTMMRVLRQIEGTVPHTVPCLRKAQELQRLQSADRDQEQERRERAPVALQMVACGPCGLLLRLCSLVVKVMCDT